VIPPLPRPGSYSVTTYGNYYGLHPLRDADPAFVPCRRIREIAEAVTRIVRGRSIVDMAKERI
jgi:hypothetical protein